MRTIWTIAGVVLTGVMAWAQPGPFPPRGPQDYPDGGRPFWMNRPPDLSEGDWAPVARLLRAHSPRRWAYYEQSRATPQGREMQRTLFVRLKGIEWLQKDDPAVFQNRLKQVEVEDVVFGAIVDLHQSAGNADAKSRLSAGVRQLVDLRLAERDDRMQRVDKLLAMEKQHIEQDRKKRESTINAYLEKAVKNDLSFLRPMELQRGMDRPGAAPPTTSLSDRPEDHPRFGRYGSFGYGADWEASASFFRERSPNRWAAFDKIKSYNLRRNLQRMLISRYRALEALKKENPALHANRLKQVSAEDAIFGAAEAIASAASETAAGELRTQLQQTLGALVDLRLGEREIRLAQSSKMLAAERRRLKDDQDRRGVLVEVWSKKAMSFDRDVLASLGLVFDRPATRESTEDRPFWRERFRDGERRDDDSRDAGRAPER